MNRFVEEVHSLRSDLSRWLVHFTHGNNDEASKTLSQILSEESLRSTANPPVICFTEAPLCEFSKVFKHCYSRYKNPRFAPYGIAVRKQWAFERGGRPVIYGPEEEKRLLPEAMQWRHVTFTPAYDFMWMREWRVPTKILRLDAEETLVIVPNDDAAFGLTYEMGADQEYAGPDEYITEYWRWRDWYSFSLDQIESASATNDQIIAKAMKSQELRRREPEERE